MGTSGQCFRRTRWQNLSISQKATVRIPARSSPSEKAPMPLKRSRTCTSLLMLNDIIMCHKSETGVPTLMFCYPERLVAFGQTPIISPVAAHLMRPTPDDVAQDLARGESDIFLRHAKRDHRVRQKFSIATSSHESVRRFDDARCSKRDFVDS